MEITTCIYPGTEADLGKTGEYIDRWHANLPIPSELTAIGHLALDTTQLRSLARVRRPYQRLYIPEAGAKYTDPDQDRFLGETLNTLQAYTHALHAAAELDVARWGKGELSIKSPQLRYGRYSVPRRAGDAAWHSEYVDFKKLKFIYSVVQGTAGGTEGLVGDICKSELDDIGELPPSTLARIGQPNGLRYVTFPIGTIIRFVSIGALHAASLGRGWRLLGITHTEDRKMVHSP